jgi:hypothetical protein
MTDSAKDDMAPKRATRRKATRIGVGVLAGGFALAGGSALFGGTGAFAAPASHPASASVPATTAAPVAATPAANPDDAAVTAFLAAGYTYDDAVALAKTWGSAAPYEAKAAAGRKLEAGETLPIAPGSAAAESDSNAAVNKFFDAGYTYDDAVALAKLWGGDPYEAKATAGQKLLNGETLPVKP